MTNGARAVEILEEMGLSPLVKNGEVSWIGSGHSGFATFCRFIKENIRFGKLYFDHHPQGVCWCAQLSDC